MDIFRSKNTDAGPPNTLKADVFFAFNFLPQFKYEECSALVSISEHATNDYFEHLHHYLMTFEPRAIYVGSGSFVGQKASQYEILFANECHRQTDILKNARDSFLRNFPNLVVEISPNPYPAKIDHKTGPFWIDSIDYDPEHWRLKRLAMGTCNPNRWQALATYLEHIQNESNSNQIMSVYLYLLTAKALGNNSQTLAEKINRVRKGHNIKDADQFQRMIREYIKMSKC